MMIKRKLSIILNCIFQLILLIFLTSCNYGIQDFIKKENSVDKRSAQITHLEFSKNIEKDVFTVVAISDIHFGQSFPRECDKVFFYWMEQQK